jgi:hypothetical protein
MKLLKDFSQFHYLPTRVHVYEPHFQLETKVVLTADSAIQFVERDVAKTVTRYIATLKKHSEKQTEHSQLYPKVIQ